MGYRYDTIPIPKTVEKTPSGGLKIPARLARTGIQKYTQPDGSIRREYRPPSEVFRTESLASFRGAPVAMSTTGEHPRKITPTNWRQLAVGHVGDDVSASATYVEGNIYIDDVLAIEKILKKEIKELSAGYEQRLLLSSGQTQDGDRYDAVQTDIKINHILLVPPGRGRGGAEVSLRLDSNDDAILGDGMEIKINGVTYTEMGSQLAQAVIGILAELEQHRGRADAAEARADSLSDELTTARDPKNLDALIEQRVTFLEQIKKIDPDIRLDGRTEEEILRESCGKKFKLSGNESLDYLRGLLQGQTVSRHDSTTTIPLTPVEPQRHVRWTPEV